MDKLLETIAAQVPSLIVLAVIVRWFLSHLESRDEFIKALHTEHIKPWTAFSNAAAIALIGFYGRATT